MTAPLWFRKLPIREDGEFALLPLYVRGLAAMILKFCDDQGRIALGGRTPADVVARRCGAEPNERRVIARDIEQLIKVGYLRISNDALLVIDQAIEWDKIGSSRTSRPGSRRASDERPTCIRRASEMHPTSVRDASDERPNRTRTDLSAWNHSGQDRQQEETRSEKIREEKRREISPIGESEGDKPPRTDPTPSLLGKKFDEAVGRGPASWGMEGSGPSKSDPAKDQLHPTPRPAPPSPPSPRPEPRVAVVDPKPVQAPDPPLGALFGGAAPEPPTPAPKAKRKPPVRKASQPVEIPLPKDWAPNEGHYTLGAQKYGLQKLHVDFEAEQMRDHAEQHGRVQVDWDAAFRTWLRKGWEFRKGALPNVLPPPEPKRPMPPPPPLDPLVAAGAERAKQRMESGEVFNLRELFRNTCMRFPDEQETPVLP